MTLRRGVVAGVLAAVVVAGACSGGDDETSTGVMLPTTSIPNADAGHEPPAETISLTEALERATTAASSADLCDVVDALTMPLPDEAIGTPEGEPDGRVVELYETLAAAVRATSDLAVADEEFPRLDVEWRTLGSALDDALVELRRSGGSTDDAVFRSILQGDEVTDALVSVERYDRLRCSTPR